MQHPTCTNIRIRSVQDAHRIFYAVRQGLLHMVTRRLDDDERMLLRTGCVYAWEERGPHTELTGLGIERFTEGRRWSPSRVRDEFLFYYEKYSSFPEFANLPPPRDWDPLVKQTYSVWVETERGRRKWHLTAYFTQATVDQLGSIDDMRIIRDLVVPPGLFIGTRAAKHRAKLEDSHAGGSSQSPNTNAAIISRYAPFPAPTANGQPDPFSSGQVLMYQPYPNHNISANQRQDDTEQYRSQSKPVKTVVPRDHRSQHYSQPYRPLRPSSHLRVETDRLHHNNPSDRKPEPPQIAVSDPRRLAATLPQDRPHGQGISPSHPHMSRSARISSASPLTSSSVSVVETCTPDTHAFPAVSTPGCMGEDSGTLSPSDPSIYCGGRANGIPGSAARSSPYLHAHPDSELTASRSVPPFHFKFLHSNVKGVGNCRRESLQSLHIPQELSSVPYHVPESATSPASTNSSDDTGSMLCSSDLCMSGAQDSNNMDALCGQLDLAPLNVLVRIQPYRREAVDDKTLRMLGPQSS